MTDKNNGVLVVVEVAESQPVDLGLEMLGLARQLKSTSLKNLRDITKSLSTMKR